MVVATGADQVLERVVKSLRIVRKSSPTARIFFVGLYNPFITAPYGKALTPMVNRWNAKLGERFADDPNIVIVQTSDLFAYHDRVTLGPIAMKVLAKKTGLRREDL